MNKNKSKLNTSGFTLIELLISMAMVAILAASTIQIARFSDTNKNLTLAADQVRVAIRTAQSYSLAIPNSAGQHVCGFGFRATANDYEIFYTYAMDSHWKNNSQQACDKCRKYGALETEGCKKEKISTTALPEGVTISSGNTQHIFFKAPYGEVYRVNVEINADVIYTLNNDNNSSTKDITITKNGMIK